MARNEVAPPACSSCNHGTDTCGPFRRGACILLDQPRGSSPSALNRHDNRQLSRRVAVRRASLVRREIIRRSSSAIIAMMPTVRRFGFRHVRCDEINAGLFETKQEVCIPAETINLGDDLDTTVWHSNS